MQLKKKPQMQVGLPMCPSPIFVFLSLSLFILVSPLNVIWGQTDNKFFGSKVSDDTHTEFLNTIFLDYDLYHIDSRALSDFVHHPDFRNKVSLSFGDEYDWDIFIEKHSMRGNGFHLKVLTDKGLETITPSDDPITFAGHLDVSRGGEVRLSIDEHFLFGYVTREGKEIFIEPLNKLIKEADKDIYVVYRAEDARPLPGISCGVTDVATYGPSRKEDYAASPRMGECFSVELAVATDRSMFDEYGSTAAVQNHVESIWNLVEPDYKGHFADDVEFKIVTLFIVTTTDPATWTTTLEAGTLLGNFLSWGNSGGFGAVTYDLAQLWTNRDISGSTVGIAYLGVVCTSARYQVIEDLITNTNSLRQVVTHETGHNFNASHDASGSPHIMAPAVNGSSTWSTGSVSSIDAHISSRTCLDACVKCLRISGVNVVYNCGDQTYNLEVTIEHTGRTPGSPFNVNAGGDVQSFNFTASSPQTVTLTGLNADGASGVPLTVNDPNDSDPDCTSSTTYNAPDGNCIQSQDFASCGLPAGWTNTAVGTNAAANWEFGNNTYGKNNSAGSINNSCMVFFDDDFTDDDGNGNYVNNGSEIMRLFSPPVDLNGYGSVVLTFDYNFRTFDGADVFQVEVWNGSSWVNLLNASANDCGEWGCTTPFFSANVDAYLNDAFQVRFTYNDGDTWQWFVAMDNFQISGNLLAPLPVDISAFTARETDCQVELYWQTASERDNDYFEIQRSTDGKNFVPLHNIPGAGNSAGVNTYTFTDKNPEADNYYRLRQVDYNGESTYSQIRNVRLWDCKELLNIDNVYPNPVRESLKMIISSNVSEEGILEIYSATGRLVAEKEYLLTEGTTALTFEAAYLPAGVYYLRIKTDRMMSSMQLFTKN